MLSLSALILACALAAVLGPAWGPGSHLEFAERVWRRRRENLKPAVAGLLGRERKAFLYGNIAADIVNFKGYGGHYNHCHRWTIVEHMGEHGRSEAEQAFALGYLGHLAADTIAHNHFVPYHLARFVRGRQLGHLYWEMNADRYVPDARWNVLAELKADTRLGALDELVNATVPRRLLPMRANKLIFNHVLLVSEGRTYRNGVQSLHPLAKVSLKKGFLEMFRCAAVKRVELALQPGGIERLAHIDTNGKLAQLAALRSRRGLLDRLALDRARRDVLAEARASPFLEGMESPPRSNGAPHWA